MLIAGPPTASLDQLRRNLGQFNPHPRFAAEMLPALWKAAIDHRIDPTVMVAQAGNETAWGRYGGVVDASYHNTCGLKTRQGGDDKDPAAHWRAPDWSTGARGHAEHLCAYLGVWVAPPRVDPRWDWVWGKPPIRHVEELTGSWATQPNYGTLVLRNAEGLLKGAPMTTEFVSRAQWGHRGGRGGNVMGGNVPYVVCHHTPGQEPTNYAEALEEIAQVLGGHLAQNWGDIGYTWLVWDRYALEGRGWGRTGAHAPGANSQSIGIAFLLDGRNRAPTATEWNTAADICRVGVEGGYLRANFETTGHRDWVATACPSEFVYGNLPKLRAAYEGALPPVPPPPAPRKRRRATVIEGRYRMDPADRTRRVEFGDRELGVAHVLDFLALLPGGTIYHHPWDAGGESLVKFIYDGRHIGENTSSWGRPASFTVPAGGVGFGSLIVPAGVEYGAIYYPPLEDAA